MKWAGEPLPAEAKVSFPGFDFASAIRSVHCLHAKSRVGDQDHRRRRDVHDRHEISDRVVGQLAPERDVHVQRRRGEQQCVAVRRRLRNRVVSDRSAGPGLVLDDDRLPKRLLERVLHGAQHDIGDAAGGPRNDYVYRSVRVMGLCGCDADRCCTCEKHGNYAGQSTHHEPPPDPTGCRILIGRQLGVIPRDQPADDEPGAANIRHRGKVRPAFRTAPRRRIGTPSTLPTLDHRRRDAFDRDVQACRPTTFEATPDRATPIGPDDLTISPYPPNAVVT